MHCQVVSLTVLCGELLARHDSGEVQELSGHLLQEVRRDAGILVLVLIRLNVESKQLGVRWDNCVQRLELRKSPFSFCVTLMYIKAGTVKTKSKGSPCPICKGLKMVTFLMVYFFKFLPCTLLSLNKCYFELFIIFARENFLKLKSSFLE